MRPEHLFQMTAFFMMLQMICMNAAYTGGAAVRTIVRTIAGAVVNFGPMALLVYILAKISRLS